MIKKLLLLSSIICLLFSPVLSFENESDELFQRLARSSHPAPLANPAADFKMPFQILSGEVINSIFLNVPLTVDETGQYQMQNESSIAVNPTNPENLISSAVDYRDTSAAWVYVSGNGGKSWKNVKLGRPFPGWTSSNDPSVAFDVDGTGYMVYGAFGNRTDTFGTVTGENAVLLAKTTDQGLTWKAHIPVILHKGLMTLDSVFEDKYYITVDNSPESPYFKNLYIPWKRVTPKDMGTQIVFSKSTDNGETWSVPVNVSEHLANSCEDTTFGQSFPLCTTGPNGEIYVVWNYGPKHGIGFAKSTDGGNTFSIPKIIITYNTFGKATNIQGDGWRHTVKEKVRAESYPTFICDYRSSSTNKGYIYLCWAADNPPNIYFSRSTDGGENWSTPKIVHEPIVTDHFWPWLAMDPKNGDLSVMYFDSRNDSTNILVDCYVSYSSDGGNTWLDRRASDISSDLRLNPFTANSFAGDYSGCAFYGGKIYPSWVDMRNAVSNLFDSDVYSSLINVNAPMPPTNLKAVIIPQSPDKLQFSWTAPTKRAFGQMLNPADFHYTIFVNDKYETALTSDISEYTTLNLTSHSKTTLTIYAVSGTDTSRPVTATGWSGGSKEPGTPVIVNISGKEDRVVEINVNIPSLRLDSTTPFVNPSHINVYRDSVLSSSFPLDSSNVGQTLPVYDTPDTRGYYNYYVTISDNEQPSNTSFPSGEKTVYTGIIEDSLDESFDNLPLQHYFNDMKWSATDSVYVSSPNSLATSPNKNYSNGSNYEFRLFPVGDAVDSMNKKPYEIQFDHIALVEPKDSALVEASYDNGNTWEVLGSYSRNSYPDWSAGSATNSIWKKEKLTAKPSAVTIFRFRLTTNGFKTDKGWYIDDIKIKAGLSNVVDDLDDYLLVYPNPAKDFITIFSGNENIKSLTICDLMSQKKAIAENNFYTSGNNTTVNISDLPVGIYFIEIKTDKGLILKKFNIIR